MSSGLMLKKNAINKTKQRTQSMGKTEPLSPLFSPRYTQQNEAICVRWRESAYVYVCVSVCVYSEQWALLARLYLGLGKSLMNVTWPVVIFYAPSTSRSKRPPGSLHTSVYPFLFSSFLLIVNTDSLICLAMIL